MAESTEGGELRSQLEASLKRSKELEAQLRPYKVRDALDEGGFDLVSAEDLADVPDAELVVKAESIQTARRQLKVDALKQAGHSEQEIEDILKGKRPEPKTPPAGDGARQRIRTAVGAGTGGTPPKVDTSQMSGREKIDAYFSDSGS